MIGAVRACVLTGYKELNELAYWFVRKLSEKRLSNEHYRYFYTTHYGIDPEFYAGKRLLDIGCGPRGSLEWAHMAGERIGLDPLAKQYLRLGARDHKMTYVAANAEAMPFPDRHFDCTFSFNSLDHVADLDMTVAEIKRVTKPGGSFLLITDVNHEPTVCEPQRLSWDVVKLFEPEFKLDIESHFERGQGMYDSIRRGSRYDHDDDSVRYGLLSAKFSRAGDSL
jgi:ubiquinone/menaquinone biosynthesis C-methylase UbiE